MKGILFKIEYFERLCFDGVGRIGSVIMIIGNSLIGKGILHFSVIQCIEKHILGSETLIVIDKACIALVLILVILSPCVA